MAKDPSERWYEVSRLRERRREMELAQAESAVTRAKADAEAAAERLAAEADDAAARCGGDITAAELALLSDGLRISSRVQEQARARVEAAQPAADAARNALADAARQRLVAERWRAQKRAARIAEAERKADRERSDRAGRGRTDG